MTLPCEKTAKYVFPVFRSLIARELVEKYNFTQVEAAKKLGTTQAAISQYLHAKRGYGNADQIKKIMPKIQELASDVTKRIVNENLSPDQSIVIFCEVCRSIHTS
ncbi:Fis family transcriptional regulator [Candidatus Bathyarchaeota archaeon]|nr:Fis family transcriptional regulator [Candidatus Bathyarchaeota archaeon]